MVFDMINVLNNYKQNVFQISKCILKIVSKKKKIKKKIVSIESFKIEKLSKSMQL